jgi:Cortactin-binding protein-2
LKAEKAKHYLYEAKYGRFGGLGDHCQALQRDSELNADTSFDEAAVRSMYDDQLTQLDNLIATQHRAQQKMREQLAAIDKRYHKVHSFQHHQCLEWIRVEPCYGCLPLIKLTCLAVPNCMLVS